MDYDKAKRILDASWAYVDFEFDDGVVLDGTFTLEELEAVLVIFKARKEANE